MDEEWSIEERGNLHDDTKYSSQSVSQVQQSVSHSSTHGRNAALDPKFIRSCHMKLMTAGSIKDFQRCQRLSTSRSEEQMTAVRAMFKRSTKNQYDRHPERVTFYITQYILCRQKNSAFEYVSLIMSNNFFLQIVTNSWNFLKLYLEMMTTPIYVQQYSVVWRSYLQNLLIPIAVIIGQKGIQIWQLKECSSDPKCGITSTQFVGPYFLRDTMNSQSHLERLQLIYQTTSSEVFLKMNLYSYRNKICGKCWSLRRILKVNVNKQPSIKLRHVLRIIKFRSNNTLKYRVIYQTCYSHRKPTQPNPLLRGIAIHNISRLGFDLWLEPLEREGAAKKASDGTQQIARTWPRYISILCHWEYSNCSSVLLLSDTKRCWGTSKVCEVCRFVVPPDCSDEAGQWCYNFCNSDLFSILVKTLQDLSTVRRVEDSSWCWRRVVV
jgi:hypothetical protein